MSDRLELLSNLLAKLRPAIARSDLPRIRSLAFNVHQVLRVSKAEGTTSPRPPIWDKAESVLEELKQKGIQLPGKTFQPKLGPIPPSTMKSAWPHSHLKKLVRPKRKGKRKGKGKSEVKIVSSAFETNRRRH